MVDGRSRPRPSPTALFGALLALAGCARTHDYVTGEPTLNRFTLAEEIELGSHEATLLLASAEELGLLIDPDRPATRAVRTIAARILAVPENRARMPALPWEIHVVDEPTVNAWTFPGGQVVLMAGLLDSGLLADEDEAAAAIGHELAHAAARHGTERRTIEELRAWLAPFGTFLGPRLVELATPERPREVLRALGEGASDFSRSQELEADLIGLELMTRAGYDPEKALHVWRRLAAHGSASANAWRNTRTEDLDDGSTHPSAELRLAELERHLPVARYLRTRQVTAPPMSPEKSAWRHTPDRATEPSATATEHAATATEHAATATEHAATATEHAATTEHAALSTVAIDPPARLATLDEAGPLVRGAHVPTRWVRPPPALLALDVATTTRAAERRDRAERPTRLTVTVRAARELFEDQLRYLVMEQRSPGDGWPVVGRYPAHGGICQAGARPRDAPAQ